MKMWKGLQNTPGNLNKRSNLQKLVFCLKNPTTTMSKLLHISLLAKHISFLVFVFTKLLTLAPGGFLSCASHCQLRADVQELDNDWSNFTVIDNRRLVALELHFSV